MEAGTESGTEWRIIDVGGSRSQVRLFASFFVAFLVRGIQRPCYPALESGMVQLSPTHDPSHDITRFTCGRFSWKRVEVSTLVGFIVFARDGWDRSVVAY